MQLAWSRFTLKQRLALTAFLLGAVALFGNPYRGGGVTVRPQELAVIVETQVDHVRPLELAQWLMAGRSDYRLLDLRTEKEFAEYHIPNAENVPITALGDAGLERDEKIVVYSEGGIHSAQAWFLLRAQGYRGVYILFGGLDGWKDDVLFPVLPENATPEQTAEFARAKVLAEHFGGQARVGGAAVASGAPALPQIQAPVAPVAPAGTAPAKKKKEGC